MSLLHAVVSRGATILAEHGTGSQEGSYSSGESGPSQIRQVLTLLKAVETILSRIPPNSSKLTYGPSASD